MTCRIDITGRKTWNDNNAYRTRPPSVDIDLLRDGEDYKTVTLNSMGDNVYKFVCLPIRKSSEVNYKYQIAEPEVVGYTTTVDRYNVINTLIQFTITGQKTWADNHNEQGKRPASITVNLLQNGAQIKTTDVLTPPNTEETATFSFTNVPFADAQGKPYVYTVDEAPVDNYLKKIDGFNITNSPLIP